MGARDPASHLSAHAVPVALRPNGDATRRNGFEEGRQDRQVCQDRQAPRAAFQTRHHTRESRLKIPGRSFASRLGIADDHPRRNVGREQRSRFRWLGLGWGSRFEIVFVHELLSAREMALPSGR
jgi:hypothetical protein